MAGDMDVNLTEEEDEAVAGLEVNIIPTPEKKPENDAYIMYNLCNEPWLKYDIVLVADNGRTNSAITSRLRRGYALYMENRSHRYELCFNGKKVVKGGSTSHPADTQESQKLHSNAPNADGIAVDDRVVDVFRFSLCKKILSQVMMLEHGIPHPVDLLQEIHGDLVWEDMLWSDTGVWIGGKEYKVLKMLFISPLYGIGPLE